MVVLGRGAVFQERGTPVTRRESGFIADRTRHGNHAFHFVKAAEGKEGTP